MDLPHATLMAHLRSNPLGLGRLKRYFGHLYLILALLFSTNAIHAQSPVVLGWDGTRPLAYADDNGALTGLFVDLAAELGAEIGFDVTYKQVPNLDGWIASLVNGTTDIIPGVPKLDPIADTALFSQAAFVQQVRLMVLVENAHSIPRDNLTGFRVGTIPPATGSDPAILPGATVVPFASAKAAMIDLLSGDIDAISAPTFFTLSAARAARVDHRVTFTAEHLLEYELYVALHESRADLLDPINAALTRMEQDGRLQDLARHYAVELPAAVPEVLMVGVYHFPPFQVVNADDTVTGFSVEFIRDVARRAGLKLAFKELTLEEWQAGPGVGGYDMLPQAEINDDRRARMEFAYPVKQAQLSIYTRAGENDGITDLSSLQGKRVGISAAHLFRGLTEIRGDLMLVMLGSPHDHLNTLLGGDVDAVLYPPQAFNELIQSRNLNDRIIEITPPIHTIQRAPALRPGLGAVREQLNAIIPGYLASTEYRDLRTIWFEEPSFWTRQKISFAIGSMALALVALILLALWHWQRGQRRLLQLQRRELANETVYNEHLKHLVHQLERSNENLNDFAYIASHDLKEPLRGIAINADFLLREDVSGASKKRIDRMVVLTTRMEQLISDLLFFSRLGRDERNRENVNLINLLRDLKSDLRETLGERGGMITVATHLPAVSVERSRVRTVFYNLIMNGITYNDSNKKLIEIGFRKVVNVNGATLRDVFFVKDNGIGIDEKNRDKVFRIFTRLNRESEYGRGTGAGLSFVKKVLEIYDCELTFASQVGVGTTFFFTLPIAKAGAIDITDIERTVA